MPGILGTKMSLIVMVLFRGHAQHVLVICWRSACTVQCIENGEAIKQHNPRKRTRLCIVWRSYPSKMPRLLTLAGRFTIEPLWPKTSSLTTGSLRGTLIILSMVLVSAHEVSSTSGLALLLSKGWASARSPGVDDTDGCNGRVPLLVHSEEERRFTRAWHRLPLTIFDFSVFQHKQNIIAPARCNERTPVRLREICKQLESCTQELQSTPCGMLCKAEAL